jgi:uncharacterized protein YcfJ
MENVKLICLTGLIALGACTAPMERSYTVDGPRNAMFASDMGQCKAIANSYRSDARHQGAMVGAASGAVFGALDNEDDRGEGALVGAAIGALAGVSAAEDERRDEQRNVVIRCMQNRGHNVVG